MKKRLLYGVLALLAAAQVACGSALAQVDLGRARNDAAQIVADQRLVDLYGEERAVEKLIQTGVKEKVARKRVLDALIARGKEK